jgi:hypothetical protein
MRHVREVSSLEVVGGAPTREIASVGLERQQRNSASSHVDVAFLHF